MADITQTLVAGQSLALHLLFPECPASEGWALRWIIRGPGTVRVSVDGVAAGDGWDLTLTADASAKLVGLCAWQLRATKGTLSQIVESGTFVVSRDLEATTPEERILVALEFCGVLGTTAMSHC